MVWHSGLVLAQALTCDTGLEYIKSVIDEQTQCEDSNTVVNCLELGAGLGACGLALAHNLSKVSMKARILLTDASEAAVKLLNKNIQRNQQSFTTDNKSVNVEAAQLRWGDTASSEKYQLMLGSDLLYNTNESYEPLVQTMTHHLHPDGRILLAVRWRKPDLEKRFFEIAAAKGLKFDLWTDAMDASEFKARCPCRLSWREYGDSECDAFQRFFCGTTISVANKVKTLAGITESDMEGMADDEYTKFEESQVQMYVGRFVNENVATKKRSIDDISG